MLRGVAGLAAYRAFLGEVAVGPWRRETPSTFGTMEGLRAEDVACRSDSHSSASEEGSGGAGTGSSDAAAAAVAAASGIVVVDLSLAWNSEGFAGRGGPGGATDGGQAANPAGRGGVFGPGSPWATSHCDVWRASGQEEGGWRWLGRAYGRKYRLTGLRVDGTGSGEGGERRGGGAALVLAVQQVNAMGYRQVSWRALWGGLCIRVQVFYWLRFNSGSCDLCGISTLHSQGFYLSLFSLCVSLRGGGGYRNVLSCGRDGFRGCEKYDGDETRRVEVIIFYFSHARAQSTHPPFPAPSTPLSLLTELLLSVFYVSFWRPSLLLSVPTYVQHSLNKTVPGCTYACPDEMVVLQLRSRVG